MAVDYLARKSAKKNRKRDAAEGAKPRRERKKQQSRRLCRGTCYQDPKLSVKDLDEGQEEPRGQARPGELAKFANLIFGEPSGDTKPRTDRQVGDKHKQASHGGSAARRAEAASGASGKKLKLSTAINLLDACTTKTEALRQKQLPTAAVSAELQRFPELLQRFMAGEGFAEPMPIQLRCWPLLLSERDVQAVAEPGSGKTLAYVLPTALLAKKRHDATTEPVGPLALILVPSRELAQQVASVCRDLRKYSGLRTCCIHGGVNKQQQVEALNKQPHIVVATPGRLLDLVQDNTLQLGHVCVVVLDEADKMLSLGFAPQIEQLKKLLLPSATAAQKGDDNAQKKRRVQVGLFTATMPESLDEIVTAWLHRPERISVSASAASISQCITQVVQVCAEHKKPIKLQKHVEKIQEAAKGLRNPARILIFVNKIKTCRFVHKILQDAGHRVTLLHGERSQEERETALADFRSGKAQMMVATDVAARGLHIKNLPYILNYDMPSNLEDYVHRVGRTGRLATDGHAFTFFTRETARLAAPLVDLLQKHSQQLDPNLIKLAEAFKTASEQLGLLAEATGEARGVPKKEDVLRQLGMKTQQQKKNDRQQQQRKAAKVAADSDGSESEGEGTSSGDVAEARHGKHGSQQPPAAGTGGRLADDEEPPQTFMPSSKFAGARPGFCFKKGGRGLGYYLDAVQQKQQQQQGSKRCKAAAMGKQQQKEEYKQLKQKYTHAPIGGSGQAAQAAKQHLLPGRVKDMKRQRQQVSATGQLAGFSDDEEAPAPAPPSKRPKTLPGRLRKKLAKQRVA